MKIQINKQLGELSPGQVINLEAANGVPLSVYWRRRLKDAEHDQCCQIVQPPATTTTTKPKSKSRKGEDL